jgi:hypothetical protein
MVKYLIMIAVFVLPYKIYSQTGIGTTTPHASAKLHVSASDKGFLPPRVTLSSATDASTIPSPAEGLLVYNLGSLGLQAGYYYWNGANWTTIATALLAGDNVQSANLVKLYQESYSTALGKVGSTGGHTFTVPVSGRYEFNFNSTGWNANGSKVLLTFNIRQGTTVLGTDYHESTSSNAWVECEGRVEVNLIAGTTYNAQVVTTTGGQRDSRDWDKIFYKQVAGNLPINQHIASANLQLNNNFISNDGGNEGIRVDNSGNVTASGNISASNFIGSGSQLTDIANRTTGTWNVTTGESDYSFTVSSGSYVMWVFANIPNGIIAWNATVSVTNSNVPVVGSQYAWVYNGGGTPIDFTTIPNQITGTNNTIVRSSISGSASNVFTFKIKNTSGAAQTAYYGYIRL